MERRELPVAGLQHLRPTWAALFPSPCPPMSGPNKFAPDGARVAWSLRLGWGPHPHPHRGRGCLPENRVWSAFLPDAPEYTLGSTLPSPRHTLLPPLETQSPLPPLLGHHCPPQQLPQPLCLHSCPFPDLAQCPRLSQPEIRSCPRPPPLGMHLSTQELTPGQCRCPPHP